jgi:hypothetical protein
MEHFKNKCIHSVAAVQQEQFNLHLKINVFVCLAYNMRLKKGPPEHFAVNYIFVRMQDFKGEVVLICFIEKNSDLSSVSSPRQPDYSTFSIILPEHQYSIERYPHPCTFAYILLEQFNLDVLPAAISVAK